MKGYELKPWTREDNVHFWRMTGIAGVFALIVLALAVVQWANRERVQGEQQQEWMEGVTQ